MVTSKRVGLIYVAIQGVFGVGGLEVFLVRSLLFERFR